MATKAKQQKSSADWDLDYYKTDYESDEHWELRRRFMEVHKDKFSEDQLVCLAQVFTNIEFMGCKYPNETMQMVGELSQEVAREFRANRAKRLKRTFVKASDAAEARAKGRRTQQPQQGSDSKTSGLADNRGGRKRFGTGEWNNEEESTKNINFLDNLPYGKFVLYLVGGRNCIRSSAQRANIEYVEKEVKEPGEHKKVQIILNGKLVATAVEENLKLSKSKAFSLAFEELRQNCYSIKYNPARDKIKIEKNDNKVVCGVTKQQPDTPDEKRLDENNKGYKMMMTMGWNGGGLGSKTQGREDPVGYLLKNNRAGLGNEGCKINRYYFTQMLQNYMDSDDIRELQFEPSFTKDERTTLHELARKFNLRSSSYDKGEARNLVISKKTINDEQILNEVLVHKNAKYCDRFLVQVPAAKAAEFPDNAAQLELDM